MPPSRRLFLWLPLVVLTLFFVALGWRNGHLSMSEEDVWLAIPAFYSTPQQKSLNASNGASGFGPAPFADNEITVVGNRSFLKPISPTFMAHLKTSYSKVRLLNASKPIDLSQCCFSFEAVQFVNRFHARCVVRYIIRSPSPNQREVTSESFILKRSPLNFKDSDWHIQKSDSISVTPLSLSNIY